MKSVACGRYIIKQKLGAGSFGEIHRGEDKETGQSVAIKLESVKSHVPQLSYESKLYNIFKYGVNIPKFYWFGTESSHNAMVIELLGKSLEDLSAQFPHHRLSLKTVLMLADQMLSAVQYIHLMNFIHRDIKPDNFVMGIGKNSNKIFVIDFGLSKKYRDPHNHQHIKYTERKDLTGTARYASLAALKGIEQSRRDDLEALGFVWLYLLRGDLPWMGLDAHNRRQKYDRICQVKEETSFESLCSGFPEEFVRYFYNVRSLRFIEEPDYSHFRKMFRKLFIRLGYIYDYAYDWTVTTSHKQRSSHEIYNTLNNTSHVKTKEHKPKADFLSDREKRPKMPLNIPNQEKNKQKSKSRRGINEIEKTLDVVNINMSTAPQLSQKKGEYAKDTNDQNRIKSNVKKSKRFGKSEADAYPRMQIPRPKNDLSDSTSSDDQLQFSQLISKRGMRSTNTNTSGNLNSVSRRAMISKTPNRNSQNYGRLDRSENEFNKLKHLHPLSPTPTSTPNLNANIIKHTKNVNNSNANEDSSCTNENETQTNNENVRSSQQTPKKEANKNIKNKNSNYDYYTSESYSYEDEIEARLQNQLKKQNVEVVANISSPGNENDSDNDKNGKRSTKQHQDTPVRVSNNSKSPKSANVESSKQKSKSPGRSDGYVNGANKRKSRHSKSHFNGNNNYNTGDEEAILQSKIQRQKRYDTLQEQPQVDENIEKNTNSTPNNNANKRKKKVNSSSSEEHVNDLNEVLAPQSAPIPTPAIPSIAENNINSEENINKEIVNEQKQIPIPPHNKPEKQRNTNTNNINPNNGNSNNNNKNKLKRSLSSSIKQKNSLLESSSSQDTQPLNNQNGQHNSKQRNNQSRKSNQNGNYSYSSMNDYYSNSSFNFEQRKEPISKTPQRSTAHYATTNSAMNTNPKQDMKNNRTQIAETPDRSRNTKMAYQARHHTDVVRDKRLPIPDLSPSVSSNSSYNDNNNEAQNNKNKNKGISNHHQHSINPGERRKDKLNDKDRDHINKGKDKPQNNLHLGGETDVGVIQQRMKMPKNERDVRRERDRDHDKNDDDFVDVSESFNFSGRNIGRRSDALVQSRSPNLRPVPRPGAKKKLLASKDRRNSLRPSAIIPNWMNEKFKGRK